MRILLSEEGSLLTSGDKDKSSRSEESWVSVFVADRRAAEALGLEVRRLADSLGLEVGQILVDVAGETTPAAEQTKESA